MPITTIIFVHYAANEARSRLAKESFESLYESVKHLPVELIVVDNGGSFGDSQYFLAATDNKKITHYIRNADNLWFGYARNQGLDISTGELICIVDNDLMYKKGWLDECIDTLQKTRGKKLFTTPLWVDKAHLLPKYYRQPIEIDGQLHPVNVFAGSNCWVMWREDYEVIGHFPNHYIAGTKWCQAYASLGYAVVILLEPKAEHIGNKHGEYIGYSKTKEVAIYKKYINNLEQCLSE